MNACLARLRSLLFAPASDEHVLAKALASDADAAVADLEDAVTHDQKDAARAVVVRLRPPVVRVNGVDTPWFSDDIAATRELALDALVLPKATPEAVGALGPDGPPVIAIVETAQGLRLAYETASSPRVGALLLGAVDLGSELRLEARRDEAELLFARSKVVVDSAAAGIRAPFDAVHAATRDASALERSARLARSLGFGGKACIHPAQVPVVNAVFAPTAGAIEWAARVVEAFEAAARDGRGAVALDGEMIDLPVAERARRILDEAKGDTGCD
jgi:citrate lyase beta subunit